MGSGFRDDSVCPQRSSSLRWDKPSIHLLLDILKQTKAKPFADRSSSWHWPLGTAARHPGVRSRDRLCCRRDNQFAPCPASCLTRKGPRRPCSPKGAFRSHWGSRDEGKMDGKVPGTELQPGFPQTVRVTLGTPPGLRLPPLRKGIPKGHL